jgi:hypothetical protein
MANTVMNTLVGLAYYTQSPPDLTVFLLWLLQHMVLFGSSSPLSLELWFEGQKYAYIGRQVREYRFKLIIDVGNGCT